MFFKKKGDPLSQLEDIEVIDESTFITRIVYTSFVVNKKCDAVVLRAGR